MSTPDDKIGFPHFKTMDGAMTFRQAGPIWLESRRYHLAPRTFVDYENYLKTLNSFFGETRLGEISADQVREYQQERRQKAGPGSINKELGILLQMLERVRIPLTDYQPLPMPKDYESPGRRLSNSEEAKLERMFRAAVNHPLWNTAGLASLLSMKSGLGPGEMLSLQLKNITLDPPTIEVPRRGAKRVSRQRYIVLNQGAAWALESILNLAHERGSIHPDHYLFPFHNRDHSYNPDKSAKGYREGLRQLFAIAGIKNFRRYDFRHHAVSKALSDPRVSRQGAISYFGWVSSKMFQRYHHADLETLNVVAAAIDEKPTVGKPKPPRRAKRTPTAEVLSIGTRSPLLLKAQSCAVSSALPER